MGIKNNVSQKVPLDRKYASMKVGCEKRGAHLPIKIAYYEKSRKNLAIFRELENNCSEYICTGRKL